MVTEAALPSGELLPKTGGERSADRANETTPGKDQRVRWEIVAIAQGQADGAIIRGRLEAEGIPARIQQEPAGAAIGLTVGLLGQVKVLVPEPLVEAALDILNRPWADEIDEEDETEEPTGP